MPVSYTRDRQSNVRWTEQEYRAVLKRARAHGLSFSDYVRYRAIPDDLATAGLDAVAEAMQRLDGLEDAVTKARRALGGKTRRK